MLLIGTHYYFLVMIISRDDLCCNKNYSYFNYIISIVDAFNDI